MVTEMNERLIHLATALVSLSLAVFCSSSSTSGNTEADTMTESNPAATADSATAAANNPDAGAATAEKKSPDHAAAESPPAFQVYDVKFIAKVDNSAQHYVKLLPADHDANRQCDLLIVLHGHGSDRWQYVRQNRSECRAARDIAAEYGMIYVSPDYRASTSWMGPKAEADLLQIIAELRAEHKIRHVILAGASMGGTSALIFTALHPKEIDAVVSQNGTANMLTFEPFEKAIAQSYGGTRQEIPEEYRRRSVELVPERLTMPIAFTVGGKDTTVPPDSVRRLAAGLLESGRKDVMILDRPQTGHSTNYADTIEAFEFVIKQLSAKSRQGGEQSPDSQNVKNADSSH